jgi:hypothetical protein
VTGSLSEKCMFLKRFLNFALFAICGLSGNLSHMVSLYKSDFQSALMVVAEVARALNNSRQLDSKVSYHALHCNCWRFLGR